MINNKKGSKLPLIAATVIAPIALIGCEQKTVIHYLPATEAQIATAVDLHLKKLNTENKELSDLLAEMKKNDPNIQNVSYSVVNGEKVLNVTESSGSSISSYAVPMLAAGLVGVSSAVIANKLMQSKQSYNNDCNSMFGQNDCVNPYIYSSRSNYPSSQFASYNSVSQFDDYDSYKRHQKKEYRKHAQTVSKPAPAKKLSSAQKAKIIKRNASATRNSASRNSNSLRTSQKAFSTKRTTSRSRSMSWGG